MPNPTTKASNQGATQNKALVGRYFAAVDQERLDDILNLLTADCVFRVPTHGVVLRGKKEIAGMFRRLWAHHKAVRHYDFVYVADGEGARIAVQFRVENTEIDGSLTHKSNCNFFDLRFDQFSEIAVYMAGANTLNAG